MTSNRIVDDIINCIPDDLRHEATVDVSIDSLDGGSESVLRIAPRSQEDAACLQIYVTEIDSSVSDVVIEFGQDSRLEFDSPAESDVSLLCAICLAVMAGRVSETVWRVDDEIVRSSARIELEERVIETSTHHVGRGRLRHTDRRSLKYRSYVMR